MIRFFAPDLPTTLTLPESESGHAVRVLRHTAGDAVEVVDGKGNLFRCTIVGAHPKGCALEIVEQLLLPKVWSPSITIAVAPTKNMDRMEWLVEKLVEIGIDDFVPVRCSRSERKELKTERLEKIAVSAMKQSLKAVLPNIHPLVSLNEFLNSISRTECCRYVGYCDENTPRQLLSKVYEPCRDVVILIGPEGDFTSEEIEACIAAGFVPVTMGDNRLRTETAALVGCDTIHIVNQLNS